MISFFICLIAGFFIIIPQNYALAVFWLVVSCLTYLPLLYLPCYVKTYSRWVYTDLRMETTFVGSDRSNSISQRYAQRYNLTIVLSVLLPLYTVNYLLALAGYINPAQTIAIYQVLSVLTKGLFAITTMDIHLGALVQAQRNLLDEERAHEARRAFLKYIFHEVRSPLNSLTMGIEILERSDKLDPADRESLLMMKGSSEFMCDTLNDVLSMQKMDEGKLELNMHPFNIEEALSKVFSTYRGTMMAKNINLFKESQAGIPPSLIGDRFRVEQVLSNIVNNAIKFSSMNSSVWVSLTAAPCKGTDDTINISISVRDEGPGIPIHQQKMLFKNFIQIRPEALEEGQGSGLGLSLCKKIVTLHGGTIGVTSTEGVGSTFFFTIPFVVNGSNRVEEKRQRPTLSSSFASSVSVTDIMYNCESPKFGNLVQIQDTLVDDIPSESLNIHVLVVDGMNTITIHKVLFF